MRLALEVSPFQCCRACSSSAVPAAERRIKFGDAFLVRIPRVVARSRSTAAWLARALASLALASS